MVEQLLLSEAQTKYHHTVSFGPILRQFGQFIRFSLAGGHLRGPDVGQSATESLRGHVRLEAAAGLVFVHD